MKMQSMMVNENAKHDGDYMHVSRMMCELKGKGSTCVNHKNTQYV